MSKVRAEAARKLLLEAEDDRELKRQLDEIIAAVEEYCERIDAGLAAKRPTLHMVIDGNNGTGKTRLANAIARYFKESGYLDGELVALDCSKLKGSVVGEAEKTTLEALKKSLGGVFYLDEAPQLVERDGRSSTYGSKVIDTIVPFVYNNRDNMVMIVSGYADRMDGFLDHDEGMRGRLPIVIHLQDFSDEKLKRIFIDMLAEKDIAMGDGALAAAMEMLGRMRAGKNFANGRAVENLVEAAVRRAGSRRLDCRAQGVEFINEITPDDVYGKDKPVPFDLEVALAKIIGNPAAKEMYREKQALVEMNREMGLNPRKDYEPNACYVGPAGTGKTTFGRVSAEINYRLGLTNSPDLLEIPASALVGKFVGETKDKAEGLLKDGIGKTILLDEVGGLLRETPEFRDQAIKALNKFLEDNRGRVACILTGYQWELEAFLALDSGLASRFTEFIPFEAFTPGDAEALFWIKLNEDRPKPFTLDAQATQLIKTKMAELAAAPDWSSGRDVRTLCERIAKVQAVMRRRGEVTDITVISARVVEMAFDKFIAEKRAKVSAKPQPHGHDVRGPQGRALPIQHAPHISLPQTVLDRVQAKAAEHRISQTEQKLTQTEQALMEGMEQAIADAANRGLTRDEILRQLNDVDSALISDIAKKTDMDRKAALAMMNAIKRKRMVKEPDFCPVCMRKYPNCQAAGVLWPWQEGNSIEVEDDDPDPRRKRN